MQAREIVIEQPGGPEVLKLRRREIGPPARGEVLLRQTAIGVNYIDIQHRSGRYPLASYPAPLGFEAAGVVEQLGEGTSGFSVGDRVVYASPPVGAYADLRCLEASRLVAIPDGISDALAATVFNKGITAHYLSHTTWEVAPGQTILVHAASGGVGSLLCQWARHLGATVIGAVGSAEKATRAADLGCHHTIVTTQEDFAARVQEITGGRGVPVVYDSVGRDTIEGSLRCLSPRGLLVSFGTASGANPPFDLFRLNQMGSLYVTSPAYVTHVAGEQLAMRASAVFAAVMSGVLRAEPGRFYPLEAAGQAHRDLAARATIGASLLQP